MKCLSLWQPYASLLVHGLKRVETRGWPLRHRGPLLIHAAKTWNLELSDISRSGPFRTTLRQMGVKWDGLSPGTGRAYPKVDLPFGAVVGLVEVAGCIETERVARWEQTPGEPDVNYFFDNFGIMGPADGKPMLFVSDTERAFGDYSPGRFAIWCKESIGFHTAIPFTGRQGLFDVPDSLVREAVG